MSEGRFLHILSVCQMFKMKLLSAFDAYYSDSLFDVISRDSYIKLRKSLEQAYNSGIISVSDEDLVSKGVSDDL